jgi:CheY-like chemotaxis protein
VSDDLSVADRRILVIEDEVLIADNLCAGLSDLGAHIVARATSIDDALALLQANSDIDAAILDIKLGNEDADRVAQALADRGIPFVFLTGYVQSALADRFPDAPVCEKPTTMDVIVTALLRVIAQS